MSGRIPKRIINSRRFKNYGSGDNKSGLVSTIGRSGAVARMLNIRSTTTVNEIRQVRQEEVKLYLLTVFSELLKQELNQNQRNLLSYFEGYNFVNQVEPYRYNANTSGAIIRLRQSDFENGTVRIKKPGIYILDENISFNPNVAHDSLPTIEQNDSGLYPSVGHAAYRLGFFAAITVECDGVIIDLNGHTLEQSRLHFLQQRFYANIELASAPFIGPQGPGVALGENDYRSGNKVIIMNGTLGRSSHHGIHSNFNQDIVFHNLDIHNFQVAGIAMNGLTNGIFNNVTIHDATTENPVLFSYSQARFIRSILESIPADYSLNVLGENKTALTILNELNAELETTKQEYIANQDITSELFDNTNQDGTSDGNVYGILLNVTGVAVHDFLQERPQTVFGGNYDVRNDFIHLQDITINNIMSAPLDIVGIDVSGNDGLSGYSSNNHLVRGPFGDIFDANFNSSEELNGVYVPNTLSNAQAILGKYKFQDPSASVGTAYITQDILDWISGDSSGGLHDIVVNDDPDLLSFEYGIDAMGHIMKGNIGLFLSGADNITGKNITVSNIRTAGEEQMNNIIEKGKHAYGILNVASNNINLTNTVATNTTSSYGQQFATDISGSINN